LALLWCAALLCVPGARAQETEHAGAAANEHEESEYRHGIGLFVGAATHTEADDTGGALGLSYGYEIAPKWAIGVKLEYASSQLERDFVLLAGVVYEVAERLELAAAIGGERVEKDEIEHGEEHTVTETEALLRLTTGYAFRLADRLTLSPEFSADIGGSRVTYIYGLVLGIGL
jgi:hypothetical protein